MDANFEEAWRTTYNCYEIKLKGHLDEHWSEWFDDLSITYDEHDDTILAGPVVDQSALHGLLKKVRDLGLPLVSVSQVESMTSQTMKQNSEKERPNDHREDR